MITHDLGVVAEVCKNVLVMYGGNMVEYGTAEQIFDEPKMPYTQGLQLFTALQMQKVPSKLLLFPDEGHWVLKPQNSVLWYKTFLDWVDSWVKK